MASATRSDTEWRPNRRTFLRAAGATVVMVHVGARWPGGDTVAATATADQDTGGALRSARLRRAATAGPPTGRAHGNVIVHRTTIDGAPFIVWYGDGGRAMAIGELDGTTRAWYVDPTRRAATDAVEITPLGQLAHEIRSHFGEQEWLAMRRSAER